MRWLLFAITIAAVIAACGNAGKTPAGGPSPCGVGNAQNIGSCNPSGAVSSPSPQPTQAPAALPHVLIESDIGLQNGGVNVSDANIILYVNYALSQEYPTTTSTLAWDVCIDDLANACAYVQYTRWNNMVSYADCGNNTSTVTIPETVFWADVKSSPIPESHAAIHQGSVDIAHRIDYNGNLTTCQGSDTHGLNAQFMPRMGDAAVNAEANSYFHGTGSFPTMVNACVGPTTGTAVIDCANYIALDNMYGSVLCSTSGQYAAASILEYGTDAAYNTAVTTFLNALTHISTTVWDDNLQAMNCNIGTVNIPPGLDATTGVYQSSHVKFSQCETCSQSGAGGPSKSGNMASFQWVPEENAYINTMNAGVAGVWFYSNFLCSPTAKCAVTTQVIASKLVDEWTEYGLFMLTYTPTGCTVTAWNPTGACSVMRFKLNNNGDGFPPELLVPGTPQVVARSYTVASTTDSTGRGSGCNASDLAADGGIEDLLITTPTTCGKTVGGGQRDAGVYENLFGVTGTKCAFNSTFITGSGKCAVIVNFTKNAWAPGSICTVTVGPAGFTTTLTNSAFAHYVIPGTIGIDNPAGAGPLAVATPNPPADYGVVLGAASGVHLQDGAAGTFTCGTPPSLPSNTAMYLFP
jgi:hypothetical protein